MASTILESPEEVLSTLRKDGTRRWLYPKVAQGRHFKRRRILGWGLIVLYLVLPFLRINDQPVLLLNFFSRHFVFFGVPFFATDTLLFLFFALTMIISIVLLTAFAGRVWCGWGCPQTVYMEFVFRPIEELIEGGTEKRKKRDLAPLSWDKVWRKILKYGVYAVVAFVLSNSFLAYFFGSDEILNWMQLSPTEHPKPFIAMLVVTGLIIFDFAYFREQMCTIACPYARLQSVLLDKDSLIVGYDNKRGETRGKGKDRTGKGDCIDCHLCVDVCPTGIDIRNGIQLECLHCAQCIDACDAVMKKVGLPEGLIRYSSLQGFKGFPSRMLRPRTLLYILLLGILSFSFLRTLAHREETEAQVLHGISEPYAILDNGLITNHLRLRLLNHSVVSKTYTVKVADAPDATMVIPEHPIHAETGENKTVSIFLNFPPHLLEGNGKVRFEVTDNEGNVISLITRLLGPKAK